MKNPGYTKTMSGDRAVKAKVKLAPTVKIKLAISNQKAIGSEWKLALQKSLIRCNQFTSM